MRSAENNQLTSLLDNIAHLSVIMYKIKIIISLNSNIAASLISTEVCNLADAL